jgi:GNAT superfamily N-acetyltransferase
MDLFLEEHFNAVRISEELTDPKGITFLAYIDKELAAYARLSAKKKPAGLEERDVVEVERIYVSKEWQGHQLGYRLMEHSIDWAKRQGYSVLWLGVWENNPKAIAFYERIGMVKFGMQDFLLGEDVQHDHLMMLPL